MRDSNEKPHIARKAMPVVKANDKEPIWLRGSVMSENTFLLLMRNALYGDEDATPALVLNIKLRNSDSLSLLICTLSTGYISPFALQLNFDGHIVHFVCDDGALRCEFVILHNEGFETVLTNIVSQVLEVNDKTLVSMSEFMTVLNNTINSIGNAFMALSIVVPTAEAFPTTNANL